MRGLSEQEMNGKQVIRKQWHGMFVVGWKAALMHNTYSSFNTLVFITDVMHCERAQVYQRDTFGVRLSARAGFKLCHL